MRAESSAPGAAGPTLHEIRSAARRVYDVARRTPVETSEYLSTRVGTRVYLKCENLQRSGSYKIRGAYNRISRLTEREKSRGVVAASAGNHAQGVALAAKALGVKATIFMPVAASYPKLAATQGYGAEVVSHGSHLEESLDSAMEFAQRTGAIFVPPFDHRDVVAGQATVGLELLSQVPAMQTVVVPLGGGGLLSGIASAIRHSPSNKRRRTKIVGVQAAAVAAFPASLVVGSPVPVGPRPTIADGIAVSVPGSLNLNMIREMVDDVVTVTEEELEHAVFTLMERAKLVVEPAGAAGVAALLANKVACVGSTASVLSGGNIDPVLMGRIVARGLKRIRRLTRIAVLLPDRPGHLAEVIGTISGQDANVLETQHARDHPGSDLGAAEVELQIETRGEDHTRQIVSALRDRGIQVRSLA